MVGGPNISAKVSCKKSLYLLCCAKHNQHAKHAKARGSGGMPPQENFKE